MPAAGTHGLDQYAGPRGYLTGRGRPTVVGHLVTDQPTDHRLVLCEAAGDLGGEPGLLRDEPYVAVEVAARPPRRVPVLARHVADDERGDRAQARLHVGIEEVLEPLEHRLLEAFWLGHEIGPVAERAGDVAAVLGERRQLLTDDGGVVMTPHPRPPGT